MLPPTVFRVGCDRALRGTRHLWVRSLPPKQQQQQTYQLLQQQNQEDKNNNKTTTTTTTTKQKQKTNKRKTQQPKLSKKTKSEKTALWAVQTNLHSAESLGSQESLAFLSDVRPLPLEKLDNDLLAATLGVRVVVMGHHFKG